MDSLRPAASWAHLLLRALAFFFTGLGLGLSYYIPPGMFAISFGKEGAGVVSSFLDGTQHVLSFLISQLVAAIFSQGDHWTGVWVLFFICYVIGSIATAMYVNSELL